MNTTDRRAALRKEDFERLEKRVAELEGLLSRAHGCVENCDCDESGPLFTEIDAALSVPK